MSKSIGNYIGVSEPPREIFGKVMSIPDRLIVPYFRLVTNYPKAQIDNIEAAMQAGENPVSYKKELGRAIVGMYYDAQMAEEAQGEFEKIFAKKGLPDEIAEFEYNWNEHEIWLPKLMVNLKIMNSTSEGVRMIKQGGIYLDGERVADDKIKIEVEREYLLKVGKRGFYRLKGNVA
jgi:tyrosyl-tRNA synthetase